MVKNTKNYHVWSYSVAILSLRSITMVTILEFLDAKLRKLYFSQSLLLGIVSNFHGNQGLFRKKQFFFHIYVLLPVTMATSGLINLKLSTLLLQLSE